MEKASALEIAQHTRFAERLKLHANELEEDARDLGFELEGSASKPWIGYRKAAAVINKCTKSLKSKRAVFMIPKFNMRANFTVPELIF